MLIDLLNTAYCVPPSHRQRRWLEPGKTFALASNLHLCVQVDRQLHTDRRLLRLDMTTPTQALSFELGADCVLDCTAWTGLWLVPRAWRRRGPHVDAVLIEFIRRRACAVFVSSSSHC